MVEVGLRSKSKSSLLVYSHSTNLRTAVGSSSGSWIVVPVSVTVFWAKFGPSLMREPAKYLECFELRSLWARSSSWVSPPVPTRGVTPPESVRLFGAGADAGGRCSDCQRYWFLSRRCFDFHKVFDIRETCLGRFLVGPHDDEGSDLCKCVLGVLVSARLHCRWKGTTFGLNQALYQDLCEARRCYC